MVSINIAKKAALALPEVKEGSHFGQTDFRIRKKIFAVLHPDKNAIMVKLSLIDQSVFCSFNKEIIYPAPGGWGLKGATFINLEKIKKTMLLDALNAAWKRVAPPALVAKYFG